MQKVYSDMDMQGNGIIDLGNFSTSDVYISQTFDEQNITSDCTLIRCSGSIVIASGATVNAIDSPSLTATGDGTLLRNGYAVGDFFIGTNSLAERAGGEWTQILDRFLVGAGNSYALGSTGGESTHTLTIEEMPNHRHDGIESGNDTGGLNVDNNYGSGNAYAVSPSPNNDQSFGFKTTLTGGSQAHNNLPPYLAVNIWRRDA